MTDEVKVPKRVLRVVDACKRGQTVHLALPRITNGETNRRYWFEPSGRPAPVRSTEQAIHLGLLKPAGDTLFAALDSQTFTAS